MTPPPPLPTAQKELKNYTNSWLIQQKTILLSNKASVTAIGGASYKTKTGENGGEKGVGAVGLCQQDLWLYNGRESDSTVALCTGRLEGGGGQSVCMELEHGLWSQNSTKTSNAKNSTHFRTDVVFLEWLLHNESPGHSALAPKVWKPLLLFS